MSRHFVDNISYSCTISIHAQSISRVDADASNDPVEGTDFLYEDCDGSRLEGSVNLTLESIDESPDILLEDEVNKRDEFHQSFSSPWCCMQFIKSENAFNETY